MKRNELPGCSPAEFPALRPGCVKRAVCFAVFAALLIPGLPSGAVAEGARALEAQLHDLPVVNQDGDRVLFKSEVVGDRLAVVIPFYTTCTTAYPILVFTFTRLQDLLGERLGREVVLVSVTVEPKIDTPVRMKGYARRQKAKPGWIFLGGEKQDLEKILFGIGVLPTENLVEHNHTPLTVIGGSEGQWQRFHGYPSPELLHSEILKLLEE